MEDLLRLEKLETCFYTGDGVVRAVNGVDLTIREGEILGLVGETGCGKSVLGLSIMQLLPPNTRVRGKIIFRGKDIGGLPPGEMRKIRGKEIALIPQDPASALNPVLKIGFQVAEVFHWQKGLPWPGSWQGAEKILRYLELPDPAKRVHHYPHQLSGGMKQRVLAAMGMAGEPSLLIADEPTKGLDALVRVQVVEGLRQLTRRTTAALLLITHDLKVAAGLCDKVAVMYAGEIIEAGPTGDILSSPRHPYTRGLLSSLPSRGMLPIRGLGPSLIELPCGCKFHPRCGQAGPGCAREHPPLQGAGGRKVRCLKCDPGGKPEKDFLLRDIKKEAG